MEVESRTPGEAAIRFLGGPLAGQTISLSLSSTTIGRDRQNDIVLRDQRISRQHARIRQQDGVWTIENLSQINSIAIDQQQAARATLQHNSVVDLGGEISFVFLIRQPSPDISQLPTVTRTPNPPDLSVSPSASPGMPLFSLLSPSDTIIAPEVLIRGGKPSLTVSSNIHSRVQTYLLEKERYNLGRDSQNDIVISEPTVSAWHAQIVREGETLFFVHPHPTRGRTKNGLWYRGQLIAGDQVFRKPLERGDIFRIGDEHGTFITLTYDDGSGMPQEALPAMQPIPLTEQKLTIGRVPGNTVVLNHPQVSAHHAVLEKVAGGYRITDTNSTNHVYVNGEIITTQLLHTGDEIRIGPYRLTYTGTELRQYDESAHIRIDALHLKKFGNNHLILLNDISLVIPPRKFVALVGGSGAGKTTLLDALNGFRPAQEGIVLYNGEDYYRNLAAFNTQLGYVPQDDIVHRELTVERALYYAARLRLPADFTREQIRWRIDEVLEDVEMSDRRNLLVSKLSGGQRKRVSIALELLANPSVFFLDEPTSGLDPGLDRKMMLLLRRLADKGHTIILVTHATNNINTCDYICFLAQGGRLAYYGPPNDAKVYFGKTDFAEIYSALEPTDENPNIPAEAEARFKASPDYQKYVVGPLNSGPAARVNAAQETSAVKPPKRGNPWKQFSLLSRRYLELLKNDTGNLLILLLQAPVIGLILFLMLLSGGKETFTETSVATCPNVHGVPIAQTKGSTSLDCQDVLNFFNTPQGQAFLQRNFPGKTPVQAVQDVILPGSGQDAQKYLFIMAFAAVMFGTINGAREIVKEAPIYRRERTVNLGIVPYMFSKIAVLGTLSLLQSAILVIMVAIVAPFHQGVFLPVTLEIYITLALTALAGLMLGLAISALVPNNDRAMSFVPIILIPQVIFSGIIFEINGPIMQFIAGFFAARWSMAAMGTSIGIHGDRINGDTFSFQGTLFSTHSQGEAVAHLLLCWFFLAAMIIVLGLLIAYFLKRKDVRA